MPSTGEVNVRKRVETEFVDQTRWNDQIGRENLALVETDPDRFVLDGRNLNPRLQDVLVAAGDLQGTRVVEFGSGRGELSVELARRGAEVIGVEIGPDLVELSGLVATINGVTCDFRNGSIVDLPIEDDAAELVIGNAILHHLPRQGVRMAIEETARVLRPGGRAFFIEPMENSRLFDTIQNIVPVGDRDEPLSYRPSILNRRAWRHYLDIVEDRNLTEAEVRAATSSFARVDFRYYGLVARLARIVPGARARRLFDAVDGYLTSPRSPVRRLGQVAVISCEL